MALTMDFLEDVDPKKLGWCFNVYLIRLWEEPDKNNEEKINSIDMVIQDIKTPINQARAVVLQSYGNANMSLL
ncbi:hypothetical protein PIB30_016137 [Stylosanthes scabra]|uniref:Uncharacterized protein n=1 Tax=Stylosanthes scabra TaxID=79078 RepID=A0ABU6S7K3_9FABA|nr:hypothetical protein [Stylosanthes scabra]